MARSRQQVLVFLLLLFMLSEEEMMPLVFAGMKYERLLSNPSFGVGRDKGKRTKTRFVATKIRVWKTIKNNEYQVQGLIHISSTEFKQLLLDLQYFRFRKDFYQVGQTLSFADKILI